VFGVGDKTKGGIMNLQEKMNLADDVNEDSSSEEEEGNNAVNISPVKQEKEMSYLKNP